jgi:hypothetical protein
MQSNPGPSIHAYRAGEEARFDALEEGIVMHYHRVGFFGSVYFVIFYLTACAMIGGAVGVILALN